MLDGPWVVTLPTQWNSLRSQSFPLLPFVPMFAMANTLSTLLLTLVGLALAGTTTAQNLIPNNTTEATPRCKDYQTPSTSLTTKVTDSTGASTSYALTQATTWTRTNPTTALIITNSYRRDSSKAWTWTTDLTSTSYEATKSATQSTPVTSEAYPTN